MRPAVPTTDLNSLSLAPDAPQGRRYKGRTARFDTESTVCRYLIDMAEKQPDLPAVVETGRQVTYGDLLTKVGRIRTLLFERQVGAGASVAVTGSRCAETIATFLALESLGCVYVPLDPNWPAKRSAETLRNAGVCCLVHVGTDRSPRAEVAAVAAAEAAMAAGVPALALAEGWESGMRPPQQWQPRERERIEPRYVIHTSGSTGRPKGVVVEHRGMMNHLWSMVDALQLGSADRVGFSAAVSYVISIWQMLAAILVGGTTVILSDEDLAFPGKLLAAATRTGLTVLELVPSAIELLTARLSRSAAPEAEYALPRYLLSTGEALSPRLASRVLELLSGTTLVNAYGASECSDDVALHVVRLQVPGERMPLGTPIANTTLHLLVNEPDGWRPAAQGETGELWVGGAPVGLGYLDQPELTRANFFLDDLDPSSPSGRIYRTGDLARLDEGQMYLMGRKDRQVKVAGTRIELGEIELELARHPAVKACAAMVVEGGDRTRITAYYAADTPVTWQELQDFMRLVVPHAMVPQRWVELEELPLNSNGKIDRGRL